MCFFSCCKKREEEKKDTLGVNFNNRGCTDCCFLLFYIAFIAGWIIIASVAFRNGKPVRIVKPTDYQGNICGDDGKVLTKPYLYIPSVVNLNYGVCVERCPDIGSYVCKYDAVPPNSADLIANLAGGKCWLVFYRSNSTLWRCIPTTAQDLLTANLNVSKQVLAEITSKLSFGQYLQRGFGEIYSARYCILICAFTALGVSLLWIFLIRYVIKLLVFLTIIAVLALLIVLGILAWQRANSLEADRITAGGSGEETRKEENTFRGIAWIFFFLSVIYFTLFIWLLTRIRIAIELIKAGSSVLVCAKSMLFVPPITFVLMFGVGVWFIAVGAYIASTLKVKEETYAQYGQAVDIPFPVNGMTSLTLNTTSFVYSAFQRERVTYFMQAYNLIGIFWTLNFLLAVGYFSIASVVAMWYFSQPTGSTESKSVSSIALLHAFWRCVRYHLGSLLMGSFMIAIIQFIRFVLAYVQRKLSTYDKASFITSSFTKCVFCALQCCLLCCEKLINFINKNAYILIAIEGKNFCRSAGKALTLLVKNAIRVACTTVISSFVLFLCKILILLTNLLICWGLLKSKLPSTKIESGVFPMFLVAGVTFAVASMFLKIYDDCIDVVMLCFFIDDENNTTHFMPRELAELVGKYSEIEKKKQECEKELHSSGQTARTNQVAPQ